MARLLVYLTLLIVFVALSFVHPAAITPKGSVDSYSRLATSDMVLTNYNKNSPDILPGYGSLSKKVYGRPDIKTGQRVKQWSPTQGLNPEELGSYASGDILIPRNSSAFTSSMGRNGLVAPTARWPRGYIPFVISNNFSYEDLGKIYRSFDIYHQHTCIHFVRYTGYEPDYISIENTDTGCWASVGRMGGRQVVNLQTPACVSKIGTVLHELMHAIGFLHEQNRFERDSHVDIIWENIAQGKEDNFKKAPRSMAMSDVQYDLLSVMHYTIGAFSNNGGPTIRVKDTVPPNLQVGQREGLSRRDVEKIRRMYKCEGKYSHV